MAGLGFKDFQVGEVLTSSDVDGYLMQQTVMRFADSGARGSALGTAAGTGVALAEGMISYLDDSNSVQVYDASGWVSVSQLVGSGYAIKTDTFSASLGAGAGTALTGLTVSYSAASTANAVYVFATVPLSSNVESASFTVTANGTAIAVGDAVANQTSVTAATSPNTNSITSSRSVVNATTTVRFLPPTTSSISYGIDIVNTFPGTNTVHVNEEATGASNAPRTVATLMLLEVQP